MHAKVNNSTYHSWTVLNYFSRAIPFAYSDKLKAELNLLEEQQIIAPITTATEWCAPIVVTTKKDTDHVQMCVDLSHLKAWKE